MSGVKMLPETLFPLKSPPLGLAVNVSGASPVQEFDADVIEILAPFKRLTVNHAVSPGQFTDPAITYLYTPPVSVEGLKVLPTGSSELLIQDPLLSGWLFSPVIRLKGGSVLQGLIVLLSPANPPPPRALSGVN